jgi:PHD and RING finger domain-containing protein 1
MPNNQTSSTLATVPTIEQCAICMENLTTQEVGIPENCEHTFCLACLIEWAKVKDKELFLIKKISVFLS